MQTKEALINNQPRLILASSSPYRKELLSRLGLDFDCISPQIDETPFPDEEAIELVARLAQQKAMTIALKQPDALVIGSDQACVLETDAGKIILGKAGTQAKAIKQLQACSGKAVYFYTSLCLTSSDTSKQQTSVVATKVQFRKLSLSEIKRYIEIESPLDCAGSFKCEGLGISLFESIESKDPTALIGLPLISLNNALRQRSVDIFCTS